MLCIYFVANQVGTYTVPICKVIWELGKRCKWVVIAVILRPFSLCIPSVLFSIRRRNKCVSQVCSCNRTCLSKKRRTLSLNTINPETSMHSLLWSGPPLSCMPKQLHLPAVFHGPTGKEFLFVCSPGTSRLDIFQLLGVRPGVPLRPHQCDVLQSRCWLLSYWILKDGDDSVTQMVIFSSLITAVMHQKPVLCIWCLRPGEETCTPEVSNPQRRFLRLAPELIDSFQ